MPTYTFTAEQSAVIAARWNELANDDHQIDADRAYLLVSDNFDADLAETGSTLVEVGCVASKTGNPATFYIFEEDVTLDA